MPIAIALRDVEFGYPGAGPVLRDVDLEIEDGEFVAIAGPNGGGKTTLLRLMLGLERPQKGEALLFGDAADEAHERFRVGYVAQRATLGIDAPATVREVVTAGRTPRRGLFRPLTRADRDAVDAAIRRVGLEAGADRPIRTLSGGQQQRAHIAKALAGEPDLIVLDEPTAGVDVDTQEAFTARLDELHRDLGATILYVSHEFGAIERHVSRLVLVRNGILFDGPPDQLGAAWHDPAHVHP